MKPENWIGIVQIGITMIGMVVGPWIAVRWSIKQFRSQKWLERQGEVYSRLLENLAIIRHCVTTELNYYLRPDYQLGPNKLLDAQLGSATAEVQKIAAMGAYYLSEEASKSVDKFSNSWNVNLGCGDEDEYTRHVKSVNETITVVRNEAKKNLG